MNGAPTCWHTFIDSQRCSTAVELQSAIKYHEESLLYPPFSAGDNMERHLRNLKNALQSKPRFEPRAPYRDARSHLVEWSSKLGPPKHPKDDSKKEPGHASIVVVASIVIMNANMQNQHPTRHALVTLQLRRIMLTCTWKLSMIEKVRLTPVLLMLILLLEKQMKNLKTHYQMYRNLHLLKLIVSWLSHL